MACKRLQKLSEIREFCCSYGEGTEFCQTIEKLKHSFIDSFIYILSYLKVTFALSLFVAACGESNDLQVGRQP